LEPRTFTSLARLWQKQGKRQDAYELLAPVYDWFTEEIAQIGAAIGREFSYELVAAVAAMPQAQLDDILLRLMESLAFRRGAPPDAVYTFKHALVQDAAYDSLLKSRG
jgi:predicted ATPase